MSTVTFSNGKSATFEGTPTPADVDYVAKQMGIQPDSSASPTAPGETDVPDDGAWTKLVGNVSKGLSTLESPLTSVLATPVQLIAKAAGKPDPFAGGVPMGLPGAPTQSAAPAPVTPAGFLQKAGQAGEIASTAYMPEKGLLKWGLTGGANALSQDVASGSTDHLLRDTIFGTLAGAGTSLLGDFGKFIGSSERAKTGIEGTVEKSLTDASSDVPKQTPVEAATSDLGDTADKTPGGEAPGDPISPEKAPQIASNIANEIAHTSPELLNHYVNTTLEHADNIRVPTPVQIAENAMVKRAHIFMDQVLPKAGEAVGAAKDAARNLPISISTGAGQAALTGADAAHSLFADITQKVEQMTKHTFGSVENQGFEGGRTPVLAQMHGSAVELNETEHKQLQGVYKAIDGLANYKPTVGQALDQVTNLRKSLKGALIKGDMVSNSPVVGAVKYAIGAINDAAKNASPELAAANQHFADLKNLQASIAKESGKDLQSANLMMRRVVAGDKSGHVIPVLDQLTAVTDPFIKPSAIAKDPELQGNLVQHAILAKWATQNFGDESTKTLLQGYTSKEKETAGILAYPKRFIMGLGAHALGAISPKPLEYAQSLAKGEPQSMEPIARAVDKAMASAEGNKIVGGFVTKLRQMGMTAKNLEEKIAVPLARAYYLNKLNNPDTGLAAQESNPLAAPSVAVPQDVGPTRTLTGPNAAQRSLTGN
jgi:hypothetical protein